MRGFVEFDLDVAESHMMTLITLALIKIRLAVVFQVGVHDLVPLTKARTANMESGRLKLSFSKDILDLLSREIQL